MPTLAALLGSAALSAGCQSSTHGNGTAVGGGATTTPETAVTTTTTSTAAAGGTTTRDIGKAVWFAGFKVNLAGATATVDPQTRSGTVTIHATFDNTGPDAATFDGTMDLASAGNHYQPAGGTVPEVPGQATGKGDLQFTIDDQFTFDDAVLAFGAAEHQQAVVPLGGTGTLVALEPRPLAVRGSATANKLKVDLTGGEVRADRPRNHTEADHGTLSMRVTFNVTMVRQDFSADYPLAPDNVSLKLPDGTAVAAEPGAGTNIPVLLNLHTTVKNISVWFTVDDPPAGRYQLQVLDNWNGSHVTKPLAFTVPAG